MPAQTRGKIVIVSGPSGVGKTSVLRRLFGESPVPLVMSVSATTRPPRPRERDGVDYHFLSSEDFQRRRRRGEFLECKRVFHGEHWYGTLKEEVTPSLEAGKWVVLEIDVQGAVAVVEQVPDAVTIFIRPPSLETLEQRLRDRQTEDEAAIQRRLDVARRELASAHKYRFQVVNDDLDRAVREICDILARLQAENQPHA